MDISSVLIGVGLGVGAGYWFGLRASRKPLRLRESHKFEYSPPGGFEPPVDDAQWQTYLAAFGLQCALANVTSERAVLAAGIVDGQGEYRQFSRLMRRYGLWTHRGARYATRWHDRDRLRAVGSLREAIARGRVAPRWPCPTPPEVHCVNDA